MVEINCHVVDKVNNDGAMNGHAQEAQAISGLIYCVRAWLSSVCGHLAFDWLVWVGQLKLQP